MKEISSTFEEKRCSREDLMDLIGDCLQDAIHLGVIKGTDLTVPTTMAMSSSREGGLWLTIGSSLLVCDDPPGSAEVVGMIRTAFAIICEEIKGLPLEIGEISIANGRDGQETIEVELLKDL